MAKISYVVTATLPDEPTLDRYVRWLSDGHADAVLAGGAEDARIVRIDEPAEPLRVQTWYVFPSRAAFDAYERDHAPALRADGRQRFGPETGVSFERQVGTIVGGA